MIRLVIAKVTPSGNELLRMHFRARKREQNVFAALLLGQIRQWEHINDFAGNGTIKATGKRKVTITRVGKRMLDVDNGFSGCKALLDEIRKFGLLIDDSPEFCDLVFAQEKLPKGLDPHTVIILENV